MSSSWLSVKEGPHPTNNRFYLCEFRNVFFNHHRVLICYSVPSFKLLNVTPKFMIYLAANRLRYICFAIVINYSHCKRTLCFQDKKASIPSGLFVYKKGKSLSRIDWKFWGYGYIQRLCELLVVCAALFSKSWPYPLRICILLFLSQYSFWNWNNKYVHTLP